MRLLAFDIETLGANPLTDKVLQVGMLAFETTTGEVLGEYEAGIKPSASDLREANPVALDMNRDLINNVRMDLNALTSLEEAQWNVEHHLRRWGMGTGSPPYAVGFNVTSFDRAFGFQKLLHYRGVELGTRLMPFFTQDYPVSSQQWHDFKGIQKAHTALADCYVAKDCYMETKGPLCLREPE